MKKPHKCTCIYRGAGQPMDSTNCKVHKKYVKEYNECHECICCHYRPVSEPDIEKGYWPLCVCGHIAQGH